MQLYNLVNERDAVIASNINFGIKLNEHLNLKNEYIGPITGDYTVDNLNFGEKIFIHGHGSTGQFTKNDTEVNKKSESKNDEIFYSDYAEEIAARLKGGYDTLSNKIFEICVTTCKGADLGGMKWGIDSLVHSLATKLSSFNANGYVKGTTNEGLSYPGQVETFAVIDSSGKLLKDLEKVKDKVNAHFKSFPRKKISDIMEYLKDEKYQAEFDRVFKLNLEVHEFGNAKVNENLFITEIIK